METLTGKKWNIAGRDGVVWEFTEFSKLYFSPNTTIHEGRLREWIGEKLVDWTEYLYDPAQKELIVDRANVESDGFVWACCEECYRVETLDDHTLKLFCLNRETGLPDLPPTL